MTEHERFILVRELDDCTCAIRVTVRLDEALSQIAWKPATPEPLPFDAAMLIDLLNKRRDEIKALLG